MAIAKLDFGAPRVGNDNPLANMGQQLLDMGARARAEVIAQQQQDIANRRADAADARAQQQLQMQMDERDRMNAARQAGAQYTLDLQRALQPGNISPQNQDVIGNKVNEIATTSKSPEESAQRMSAFLNQNVPTMVNEYNKQGAKGNIDALGRVTYDPTKIDPVMANTILQQAQQPYEKQIDRQQTLDAQLAAEARRFANEKQLIGIRNQAELDQISKRNAEEHKYDLFMNPKTNEVKYAHEVAKLPEGEQKNFISERTAKLGIEAGKAAFEQEQKKDELNLKKQEANNKILTDIFEKVAGSGNPDVTGNYVAQMRAAGMPIKSIQEALVSATGGGGILAGDPGKPDYKESVLRKVLEEYKAGKTLDKNDTTKNSESKVIPVSSSEPVVRSQGKPTMYENIEAAAADDKEAVDALKTLSTAELASLLQSNKDRIGSLNNQISLFDPYKDNYGDISAVYSDRKQTEKNIDMLERALGKQSKSVVANKALNLIGK